MHNWRLCPHDYKRYEGEASNCLLFRPYYVLYTNRQRFLISLKSKEARRELLSASKQRICNYMRKKNYSVYFLLPLLLLAVTACQFTQSPFSKTTGDAGAAFAAASITLTYAHQGKISYAYAASSFVNFRNELDGLDQQLPSRQGAPDVRTVQHLVDLYKSAIRAVDSPCLNESCDWRTQVALMNKASQAFLQAGGS